MHSKSFQTALRLSVINGLQTIEVLLLEHSIAISPKLQQAFGVVVIAFAIASYFQYDTLIVAWLTAFYPNGQIGL